LIGEDVDFIEVFIVNFLYVGEVVDEFLAGIEIGFD
jgi:hypothetical protein